MTCDAQLDLGYPDHVDCNQPEGHKGDHAFVWSRALQDAQDAKNAADEVNRREAYARVMEGWPHHHKTMDWWTTARAAQ